MDNRNSAMQTTKLPLFVLANLLLAVTPLLVEILPTENPLSVDQEAEITCKSKGASANISWWLNGVQIVGASEQKNSADDNETISTLRWTPSMEANGRDLICKASRINFNHSTVETSVNLVLQYVPEVFLRLGFSLKPDGIREGHDIYFDCEVHANPPATKVVWKHNDQIMNHNPHAGVIISPENLVLQHVTREQAGSYQCIASNDIGGGSSKPVNLHIIHVPTVVVRFGSSLRPNDIQEGDDVYFDCEVQANPPAFTMIWKHNNQIVNHNPRAGVIITPNNLVLQRVSREQEGNYMCIAINEVGNGSSKPVNFQIKHVPTVVVRFGSSLRPNDIQEGDDVYFECEVQANPPAFTMIWKHNNQIVNHNPRAGVIITPNNLVLQRVSREQEGNYMCIAINEVGNGSSKPVNFQIKRSEKPTSDKTVTVAAKQSK